MKLFVEFNLTKYFKLPVIPYYATNNGHMFYVVCPSNEFRQQLISFLKKKGILAIFHYLSLHKSSYYKSKHDGRELPMADLYSDTLLRLPMYYDLKLSEVTQIVKSIAEFSAG